MRMVMTGNYASAYGAKVSRAEVIAAYPITPQTSIVEKLADFVSSGEMKAKYIPVESEHSAMAACIAAATAGARTYTATSSHGLTLMHEVLMWASAARLPVRAEAVAHGHEPLAGIRGRDEQVLPARIVLKRHLGRMVGMQRHRSRHLQTIQVREGLQTFRIGIDTGSGADRHRPFAGHGDAQSCIGDVIAKTFQKTPRLLLDDVQMRV